MQGLIEKFRNMTMEERWTEFLAYGAGVWIPVLLAAGGFMLGPIFTPYNNNLNDAPGRAHYSLEAAGICFVVGAAISIGLLVFRARAKRWEARHDAHDHDVTSATYTDVQPDVIEESYT